MNRTLAWGSDRAAATTGPVDHIAHHSGQPPGQIADLARTAARRLTHGSRDGPRDAELDQVVAWVIRSQLRKKPRNITDRGLAAIYRKALRNLTRAFGTT